MEGANLANLDDLVVSLEGRLFGPLDGVVEGVGLDDPVSGNGLGCVKGAVGDGGRDRGGKVDACALGRWGEAVARDQDSGNGHRAGEGVELGQLAGQDGGGEKGHAGALVVVVGADEHDEVGHPGDVCGFGRWFQVNVGWSGEGWTSLGSGGTFSLSPFNLVSLSRQSALVSPLFHRCKLIARQLCGMAR